MMNLSAIQDRFLRRGRHGGLLLMVVVGTVALLARVPWLESSPPGFAPDEARHALHARSIGTEGGPFPLLPRTAEPGAREPLFAWWLKLTGALAGWSVGGTRLASALAGTIYALACALWYRRALGTGWGLAGGLLVATSFWQIVLSRQISAGMLGAALLALSAWTLWSGLEPERAGGRALMPRCAWLALSGGACGLAVYAFAPLLAFVPVVLLAGSVLAWRTGQRDWRPLVAGGVALLAIIAPVTIDVALDRSAAAARIEAPFAGEKATAGSGPTAAVRSVGSTAEGLFWRGHAAPRLNLPGRALLDPLLALWTMLGIAYALRFATQPLHAFALLWLAGSIALSAIIAPGHPELLMAASPVIFLFPLIALRAMHDALRQRGKLASRVAVAIAAGAVLGSAGWSAYDYVAQWTTSPATWQAFRGDVRAALEALPDLPGGGEPVYVSTWDDQPLLDFLASERPLLLLDGRSVIAVPATAGRFLLIPQSSTPHPALLAYVTGDGAEQPVARGAGPDGEPAWEIWPLGQRLRERIPYTLPAIRFPNRIQLIGYAVGPDLGDAAQTGVLPDPPQLEIVLFWSVPSDMQSHQVEVRLEAAGLSSLPGATESARVWLAFPVPAGAGRSVAGERTIVAQRLSVPMPQTPELIVDIQATLFGPDGTRRPAYGPRHLLYGDYVFLNRIQYQTGIERE